MLLLAIQSTPFIFFSDSTQGGCWHTLPSLLNCVLLAPLWIISVEFSFPFIFSFLFSFFSTPADKT